MAGLGWHVSPGSPALRSLTGAIAAARSAGVPLEAGSLTGYARATEGIAAVDVAAVPRDDLAAALHRVVAGTVLVDPVLAAAGAGARQQRHGTGPGLIALRAPDMGEASVRGRRLLLVAPTGFEPALPP